MPLDLNQTYLLKEGRTNRTPYVAYSDSGKVIIPVTEVTAGFAKITKIVRESEKFYLAEMENVIDDYYDSIDYETFKQVLEVQGYKIGYELEFEHMLRQNEHSPISEEPTIAKEMQIFAYDLATGVIIVGETFWRKTCFNSIHVYCPNIRGNNLRSPILSFGGPDYVVFDLCYNRERITHPFQYIKIMNYRKAENVWHNQSPSLWNYADCHDIYYDPNYSKFGLTGRHGLWLNTIHRIWLAPKEVETMFSEDNAEMRMIFAHRPENPEE